MLLPTLSLALFFGLLSVHVGSVDAPSLPPALCFPFDGSVKPLYRPFAAEESRYNNFEELFASDRFGTVNSSLLVQYRKSQLYSYDVTRERFDLTSGRPLSVSFWIRSNEIYGFSDDELQNSQLLCFEDGFGISSVGPVLMDDSDLKYSSFIHLALSNSSHFLIRPFNLYLDTSFLIDEWHHFSSVLDLIGEEEAIHTLYLDGIVLWRMVDQDAIHHIGPGTPQFSIYKIEGGTQTGCNHSFLIDDVAVYYTSLTAQEVKEQYEFERSQSICPFVDLTPLPASSNVVFSNLYFLGFLAIVPILFLTVGVIFGWSYCYYYQKKKKTSSQKQEIEMVHQRNDVNSIDLINRSEEDDNEWNISYARFVSNAPYVDYITLDVNSNLVILSYNTPTRKTIKLRHQNDIIFQWARTRPRNEVLIKFQNSENQQRVFALMRIPDVRNRLGVRIEMNRADEFWECVVRMRTNGQRV